MSPVGDTCCLTAVLEVADVSFPEPPPFYCGLDNLCDLFLSSTDILAFLSIFMMYSMFMVYIVLLSTFIVYISFAK